MTAARPLPVCAAALTSGRVVLMRDEAFYSRYFLAVTSVAIDFLQTEREYRAIRDRSRCWQRCATRWRTSIPTFDSAASPGSLGKAPKPWVNSRDSREGG